MTPGTMKKGTSLSPQTTSYSSSSTTNMTTPATTIAGAGEGNEKDDVSTAERRLRTVQRYREMVWELELPNIERDDGPLLDPNLAGVLQVTIAPPPLSKKKRKRGGDDDDPTPSSQGEKVVLIGDSDDDDDDGSSKKNKGTKSQKTDDPEFYTGGVVTDKNKVNLLLKYQKRSVNPGQYPSPQAGLRFNLANLAKTLGGAHTSTPEEVSEEYERLTFQGDPPQNFEEALEACWLKEPGDLIRGFPMVEETTFFCASNFTGLNFNCFFKAVAAQVYGNFTFDARVKAEHLEYFSDVLKSPAHPRHSMYTKLNQWFYETAVSHAGGKKLSAVKTLANFYQLLTIPNCQIPMDMFEVTADLYNLFLVVYTLNNENVVTEMTTMGSFNSRHVFMLFRYGNHFQPMVPNEYYSSEFQLPRITYYSTRKYPLTSERDKNKHSLDHVYRKKCRVPVDRKPGRPPVDVVFYEETIDAVMHGKEIG